MAGLNYETVEVVLEGLHQKSDKRMRPTGKLERCINVEFDKAGCLNKRRGYAYVDLGAAVSPVDNDEVFLNLGIYQDELLIFGYDSLYSLGSRQAAIGGVAALIYRGPLNRCQVRVQYVSTSATTAVTIEQE
jgi:hypothetical protein